MVHSEVTSLKPFSLLSTQVHTSTLLCMCASRYLLPIPLPLGLLLYHHSLYQKPNKAYHTVHTSRVPYPKADTTQVLIPAHNENCIYPQLNPSQAPLSLRTDLFSSQDKIFIYLVAGEPMWNFRKKLPKWIAISLSDNNDGSGRGRRGGSKSSWMELTTPNSESTGELSYSFSSVWKPVWYTGWHTGVLACAASAVVVLFINVSLTIYVATNQQYMIKGRMGTLYVGSCKKSKMIGLWLHLGINALSTLLLSGSNYTQQCLAAPTRSEIDAVHARRRWMDIGVPSIRNLFKIKRERRLLWIAIGFTSIPLHLLYVYIRIPAQAPANQKITGTIPQYTLHYQRMNTSLQL